MQPDALAFGAASAGGERNVNRPRRDGEQPPQFRGASMADPRAVSNREDGRHPASLDAQPPVTDRIDAAMDAVEAAGAMAVQYPGFTESCRAQLAD